MTIGLPKTVTKLYSKLKIPHSLEKKLFKSYSYYLKTYIKIWTWYNYDRKNSAPLYPFKLLWIAPEEIEHGTRRSELENVSGTLLPRVLDGEWDKEAIAKIEERIRYQAMEKHFLEDSPWEETEFYQNMLERIQETGSTKYGGTVTSKQELDQIFKNIDQLYRKIKDNGYKTQREIKDKGEIVNAKLRPDHYANELNEIIVDIGRNGEILFHENRHRLYIAKILDLEKIPVRVLVRHEKWQEKRNKAVKNSSTLDKNLRSHPDIEYLL